MIDYTKSYNHDIYIHQEHIIEKLSYKLPVFEIALNKVKRGMKTHNEEGCLNGKDRDLEDENPINPRGSSYASGS